MHTIELPLDRRTRLLGPGVIAASAILVLLCGIAWPWRLSATLLVVVTGIWLWRRFLKQRPVSLNVEADGALACTRADGRVLAVSRVLTGITHPRLVCARLEGVAGDRCALFVPGGALTVMDHWRLRRALTGWHPTQSLMRRGA